MNAGQRRRGRPKIVDDKEILELALRIFATYGYEAMSMRSLNGELGLSHGTINQRFGTKEQLYLEAVDHGFSGLLEDMAKRINDLPIPKDPIEELRVRFRAFLLASSKRPHLNRLINNEGVNPSPMLDHIFDSYIVPGMQQTRRLMNQLTKAGVLEPTGDRDVLFILANGAGSLYSLPALANKFNRTDGRVDVERDADRMATLLVRGMIKPRSKPKTQPAKRAVKSVKA